MKANDVVGMAQYRGSRNALASIMEKLAAASWVSAAEFWKAHSEVTVYLCDSNAETVVVFSCKRFDLVQVHVGLPVWKHLVRSFDVIVDPTMTSDEVHLRQTVDLTIHALSGPVGIQKVCDPMVLLTPRQIRAMTQDILATEANQ